MPTSSDILNVQLIFDSYFAWTYFGSSSIFAYSKKWHKEYVSNFVWKTKLSARTHFGCWLWHEERAERPSTPTIDKNIDEVKKKR